MDTIEKSLKKDIHNINVEIFRKRFEPDRTSGYAIGSSIVCLGLGAICLNMENISHNTEIIKDILGLTTTAAGATVVVTSNYRTIEAKEKRNQEKAELIAKRDNLKKILQERQETLGKARVRK